jgi:hypothetical protein
MKSAILPAVVLLLASCGKPQPAQESNTGVSAASRSTVHPETEPPAEPVRNATATEPTIDPKSSQAAEELVRGFARLLAAGKLDQAYMLLGPAAPPRKQFDERLAGYRDVDVSVGAAGRQEGAAGSIYVTVPLTIAGTVDGKRVSRSAKAVLRRVNDVPGSTEAQRRWHIERIDWDD